MEKKYLILGIVLAAACIALLLIWLSGDLRREYERGIKKAYALNVGTEQEEKELLTTEDIRHLPEPVQKYLIYTGVIGKEKVRNIKLVFDGAIKMGERSGWTKISVEQYNFFGGHLTRLFYIKAEKSGIPIYGLHSYTDEESRMLIKLAGLVPVVDAKGREMRISDTITLLNDMSIFAPASLIDERIRWEPIDDSSAKAIFTTDFGTVSAVLYFNEKGELINFVSEERYRLEDDGSCRRAKWSTPVSGYEQRSGLRLAIGGEAVWNLPEGDDSYFKITKIREIVFND